jgi:hypothetical protein
MPQEEFSAKLAVGSAYRLVFIDVVTVVVSRRSILTPS